MRPKVTTKVPSRLSDAVAQKMKRAAEQVVKNAMPKIRAAVAALVVEEGKRGAGGDRYEREMDKDTAVKVEDGNLVVRFSDPVLIGIERGVDSFDIKAKMLAKAGKTSKSGGTYVDVPFKHTAAAAMVTPKPAPIVRRRTLRIHGVSKRITVRHKAGLLDDMISVGKTHTTIRRISTKSATSSWWHPGFRGRHVLKTVTPRVRAAAIGILKTAFADAGSK